MEDSKETLKTEGLVAQMGRIDASVRAFRLVTVASVALSLAAVVGCTVWSWTRMESMRREIYVLDGGEAFRATARDAAVTREDEVRDHVVRFHSLVFDVPPEYGMIRRNLERALTMCDRSVYEYYNDLQERKFYERLVTTGAYQQLEVTDVAIDMGSYPYGVTLRGFLYISRTSNVSKYSFTSQCRAENAVRTAQNLHGVMLTGFRVTESDLLETREK